MATIKKLYNQDKKEIGSVLLSIMNAPIDAQKKKDIENELKQYAVDVLYPNEGLSIYSDISIDIPSIIVIRNINSLPNEYVDTLPL